jgi:hypothetical protein
MSVEPASMTEPSPAPSELRMEVLAALHRSGQQMNTTLTAMDDGRRRVPGLVWSVAELAGHLVRTLQELTRALEGRPCAYDGANQAGTTAVVDDRVVADFTVRDMVALDGLFEEQLARFTDVLSQLPSDHPVTAIAPHATALALGAIFVVDHHNHGPQLARAGGPPWPIDVPGIRQCVAALVPAVYDRDAAARRHDRFELRLRGASPLWLTVDDGDVVVADIDPGQAVDCHLVADPGAFLQLSGGGFITQRRALLTGGLFAYGRKPWRALAVQKVLPPLNHGGKAPHRWYS